MRTLIRMLTRIGSKRGRRMMRDLLRMIMTMNLGRLVTLACRENSRCWEELLVTVCLFFQEIERAVFDILVQLEVEKKLAMILQTREEGRLREKLLSAQKGNVLGHHGMENVTQMMDMVPNMSGTSNMFSVFEGDGLSKNCMSGEEVAETTFATKVMGVQGAPLNLVELEMDGLGAGQTEMIEDAGTEEDKENDLRRSSRLERLGRADDKVKDRAIYNAKVRNQELPKGK
ncbi:uncharacterized protein LOC106865459 isoform X2 [Brachypodium distachyon]|uniref:uncharacterized protein LOC106865459 isoform X2 n=1 Tax=Brachypodium distachyon TaxID=15368 RepID=UPI000D0E17FD|nr:uncharacterized protein LOC106865459 isoform X2 [Brachypodium distachyon]|eukprot:XP_024312009.1 uncharacterized protein LOC106865459 isoform X2 [Brachypodium distachyon]